MKSIGFLALFLIVGIQVLFFGVQTYFAQDYQSHEEWSFIRSLEQRQSPSREPSSIKEIPKEGPVRQFKYEVIPDDFPWNNIDEMKTRIRLGVNKE